MGTTKVGTGYGTLWRQFYEAPVLQCWNIGTPFPWHTFFGPPPTAQPSIEQAHLGPHQEHEQVNSYTACELTTLARALVQIVAAHGEQGWLRAGVTDSSNVVK